MKGNFLVNYLILLKGVFLLKCIYNTWKHAVFFSKMLTHFSHNKSRKTLERKYLPVISLVDFSFDFIPNFVVRHTCIHTKRRNKTSLNRFIRHM